jgi:hypothetical protein
MTYQFDSVRWCKSRARSARAQRNFADENSFVQVAREVEELRAELAALKDRLDEAAKSLETISKQAGRGEYMETMTEVRAYAANRAMVASGEFARLCGEG